MEIKIHQGIESIFSIR